MKKDSFVKGAYIATIYVFISKILGIIYVIPFYTIIGQQGGALYGYAYNIYSIFLAISTAGIPTAVSKLISEYDAKNEEENKNRVYGESLKIISLICAVAFIFLIIFAPQIAHLIIGNATGGNSIKDISLVIRCISFAVIIVPFLSVTRGLLQGNKYITPTAKSELIEQIFRIIILLLGSYVVIKLMGKSITIGVAVSVFGASIGALGAYLYLIYVIKKNKLLIKIKSKDKSSSKEIRKKIIKYSVPLIIVSVVLSIYNFSDMVITLRVLTDILKFNAPDAERIISMYTTWGEKFQRIIAATSTGVGISLIPNIVRAYVKKEYNSLENILSKAVELVIFTGLPLTILISVFSTEVWSIFYSYDVEGAVIISYSIFIGLLASLSVITTTALQSINKFKEVYIALIVGVVASAGLDTPLIILAHNLNFHPCYGSISASVVGFSLTTVLSLYYMKKDCSISYKNMFKRLTKLIMPVFTLLVSSYILKYLLRFNNYDNKFMTMIYTSIYFGIPLVLYLIVSYKNKLLFDLLPEEKLNKIFKKKK